MRGRGGERESQAGAAGSTEPVAGLIVGLHMGFYKGLELKNMRP